MEGEPVEEPIVLATHGKVPGREDERLLENA
jgi:hypothetical protein